MKQFDLQEYLTNPSRKVVTRNGRDVRILCIDANGNYPIVALAIEKYFNDMVLICEEDGTEVSSEDNDLFFDVATKHGWVNIYKIPDTDELETSIIFNTKEEAEFHSVDNPNYVATTKITWEE